MEDHDKLSDFRRGVDLFLRIARKRVQELQLQGITIKEAIEHSVRKNRIDKKDIITPSYLSRILSEKLFPKSEETYDRISNILEIPTLFDVRSFLLPHDETCVQIGKKELSSGKDYWLNIPFEGIPYRTPKKNIIDALICPFIVELKPAQKTKKGKLKAEPGEELAVLLEGDEITIYFKEDKICKLKKGESAHYLTTLPHYTENTGKQKAHILVIRSDPSLYRQISEALRIAEEK